MIDRKIEQNNGHCFGWQQLLANSIEIFIILGSDKSLFFFLMLNEIFNGIGGKLLLAKAAPMVLLNLSIFHWSLGKNMT